MGLIRVLILAVVALAGLVIVHTVSPSRNGLTLALIWAVYALAMVSTIVFLRRYKKSGK